MYILKHSVTTTELRTRANKIIGALKKGEEVELRYHNHPIGIIVPSDRSSAEPEDPGKGGAIENLPYFSKWENRKDMPDVPERRSSLSMPDGLALVDSTVLLQHLRGDKEAGALLKNLRYRNVSSASVLYLMSICRSVTETRTIQQFIREIRFTVFEIDARIVAKAEELMRRFLVLRTEYGGFTPTKPRPNLTLLEALELATADENGYRIIVWDAGKHHGIGEWPVG